MEPALTNSNRAINNGNEQVRKLEENLSGTKADIHQALNNLQKLEELEKKGESVPASPSKLAAMERLQEQKEFLRGEIDLRIKRLVDLAKQAKSLSSEFSECLDLYQEYKQEMDQLLSVLQKNQKQGQAEEQSYSKLKFQSQTMTGEKLESSQYLKLDKDGNLLTWVKDLSATENKWHWVDAKENNKIQGQPKFECLYQHSDGSFRDKDGNLVSSLASYNGSVSLSDIQAKLDRLEEGKVSGLKEDQASDLFYKGARVVFTKAKIETQQEDTQKLSLGERTKDNKTTLQQRSEYQDVSFSVQYCNGARVQSQNYFRLDQNGSLEVWQKNNASINNNANYSWQKAVESNKQPYRMKFECLYVEADGSLTDEKGNKINFLDSYKGRASASDVLKNLDEVKENIVSGTKANIPNEYFYKGSHVVFTKRVANKIESNPVLGAQAEVQKEEAKSESTLRQTPFKKVNYERVDNHGIGRTKEVYARVDQDNKLEIFIGKDSAGKDLWKKEKETDYSAVYIYEGKAYSADGKEITSIGTGRRSDNAEVGIKYLLDKISFDDSKIGSLPESILRDHHINSKQLIFVQGKPPKNTQ